MTTTTIHRVRPLEFDEDDFRIVHHLITRWRNYHARYRVCRKRMNWYVKGASAIEKKRRQERWVITAAILQIENEIIRICATITRDPAIYNSATMPSRLTRLRKRYAKNRRNAHHVTPTDDETPTQIRKRMRLERIAIVVEIRALIRSWMSRVYRAVFGDAHVPRPITLHEAELVPRKLKKAYVILRKELVA